MPGKPLFYATAMPLRDQAWSSRRKSRRPDDEDRRDPYPLRGLGATDLFAQAAILGLYDPDAPQRSPTSARFARSTPSSPRCRPRQRAAVVQGRGHSHPERDGARRRSARRCRNSWTLSAGQVGAVGRSAATSARGQPPRVRRYVDAQYASRRRHHPLARRRLSLLGNGGLRHARAFASRRRIEGTQAQLIALRRDSSRRILVRGPIRLALRASDIEGFARAIAAQLASARRRRDIASARRPGPRLS